MKFNAKPSKKYTFMSLIEKQRRLDGSKLDFKNMVGN
jgi:hypothetical protein